MTDDATDLTAETGESIAARLEAEVIRLDSELAEIDLLVGQARAEAARHEQKRAQAAERATSLGTDRSGAEVAESMAQVMTLTRRSLMMEAQVELLEAKRRATARHRGAMAEIAEAVSGIAPLDAPARPIDIGIGIGDASATSGIGGVPVGLASAASQPSLARVVLATQEELRRDIARAMHDGPAQSLTNIMLQAQIVERLMDRSPTDARLELHQLVAMTQRTLDTTKTFIFDIRPMVLDDLGLVPTLRRTARERGRRAKVAVELESMGADRRLSTELESALFRILDEALAAYLAQQPDLVRLELDWADMLEASVTAYRAAAQENGEPLPSMPGDDVPAVIREMIQDRHDARAAAVAAARQAALVALPEAVQRELAERAAAIGATLEVREGGSEIRLTVGFHEPGIARDR
jgi:two-component system sensor histidine kinase DegS